MTNKTISALTAASLPVAGTELIPVWDGSSTVRVSIADLVSASVFPGKFTTLDATGLTKIKANAAALPAPHTGTLLQLGNVDSTGTIIELQVFASAAGVYLSRANGTAAAMTGVVSGNILGYVAGSGYDTAGWGNISSLPHIRLVATETWSATAHGSQIEFYASPNGATAVVSPLVLKGDASANFSGALIGAATQAVFNTTSTTVNAFGAATTLNIGATTGTCTVANTTLAAKAGTFSTTIQVSTGAAVGGATPGTGGIAFPATAVAVADANTLDDYEEGTWTPAITFGGGATGITYSAQVGTHTKIGNRVLFQGRIVLTAKGTSTGTALITGLPFTTSATTGHNGAYSTQCNNLAATMLTPIGYILTNSTTLNLSQLIAGVNTNLTDADFTNTTVINFSGQYLI